MTRLRRRVLAVGMVVAAAALAMTAWSTREVTVLRLDHGGPAVRVERDIVYRRGSANPKHRLDVYGPENAKGAPVVHFVHGGYWVGGDKDYHPTLTGLYATIGEALARRGIVTVIQSYRLVPEVGIDDLVDDVMEGLRWTEQHAAEHGGDAARIFTMGHSAGGHLVALMGSDPSLHVKRGMAPEAVRGTIALSAVWDIEDMANTQDAAFQARVTRPVFGTDRARWAAYSPSAKLEGMTRPLLIVIGEHDYPYLIPQAARVRDRLTALGHAPTFHVAPGNDHDAMVLRFGARNDDMTETVATFVASH